MNTLDIYFCFCCAYPIIFRGNPPQIYHLPTGWPCWHLQQAGLCLPDLFPNLKIPSTTPPLELKKHLDIVIDLYEDYVSTNDDSKVLAYVETLIESGYGDCVRDFFGKIINTDDKHSFQLIRTINSSEFWHKFMCKLRIEKLFDDYKKREDETLILKYLEIQIESEKYYCARKLIEYLHQNESYHAKNILDKITSSKINMNFMNI